MKVLTPLLDLDERRLNEISEGLNEVNQLGATLLAFKGLDKIKPEKVTPIKVTEELRGKEATDMLDKQTQLQSLYNERNARLKSVDELKGSNQQFMKSYVSKLEERIKPLEDELGIRATAIENNIPVDKLTQEKLPLDLLKEQESKIPPSEKEMVSLRSEVTNRILPDAEKATSDLPSLEEAKIATSGSNLEQAIKNGEITTEIKPENTFISSIEPQGKEIAPKPIESIGSSITEEPKPSNSSVFVEEVPTETKLNTTDIIKQASTELNDKPINIAQKSIKIDDKVYSAPEAINHKQSWDKAVEQLGAGEVSKAFAEGRISVLDEQGNWKSLNKKEDIKPVGEVKPADVTPEETIFGATLLPADFSLKNMKSNFTENTETIKNVLSQGARLVYKGTRDFKDWSAEMSKLYGDAIQPHLQRIWLQTQGIAQNDKNQFAQDLLRYAESKNIIPSPFTRAGKEILIDNATANIREMINKGATEEQFTKAVKETFFDNPQEQQRYEELRNKFYAEIKGGTKRTTDEKIEYDNLTSKIRGDIKSSVLNNFRLPPDVVENAPALKAIYQEKFERSRTAEIESIKMKKDFETLVQESRKSTGSKYDANVLRAMAGEKVSLTPAEEKLFQALKEFRTAAGKYKENITAKMQQIYDFPLTPRGVVEAYREAGLYEAIKEKMKAKNSREVEHVMRSMGTQNMFDPYSLTRFGRTEHPSMDILKRLENYIDIYTIQKNLEPVLPTIARLEKAMENAGLDNSSTWSKNYTKELFGESFDLANGLSGNRQINTALRTLNTMASIRYLAYNPVGGFGNLIGGMVQNVVSKDLSLKELATGTKRLTTTQGFDILTERGVVDAPLMKEGGIKDVGRTLVSPFAMYGAGEHIIQGISYLGKLTPEEFRSKIISASRDRQILEAKAQEQGGYHKGLRPTIVRTTIGKSAMKFRLWVPAVLESKVQKVISSGRLIESVWKGKVNLTTKDIANLKGALKEATLVGSSILLLNELPENTKDKLGNALNSAYGFLKGESLFRQVTNIIPAMQTVTDIGVIINSIGDTYKVDSEYGAKGTSKALGNIKHLAPTFLKPLVKETVPQEIQNIRDMERRVEDVKKRAEENGSQTDIDLWKILKDKLEEMKQNSPVYQNRIMKLKEQESLKRQKLQIE